jgi:hypothetical protein
MGSKPQAEEKMTDAMPSCTDAPTLPPPAMVSVVRFRSGAPVDELLYRMGVGDYVGALDVAEELLDERAVPIVVLPRSVIAEMTLEYRECLLLACVDGSSTLEKAIDDSGLEMIDALRALCDLLDKRIVAFC